MNVKSIFNSAGLTVQAFHRLHLLIFCSIGFLLFISCSGDEKNNINPQENVLKSNIESQQPKNLQAGNEGLNIDVCELIPDKLVAQALNSKILKPAQSSNYGSIRGCTYTVDPAGEDNIEICTVWFNPPSTFTSPEDELETAHGLGQEATAEYLEGYGDKAFVVHNQTEQQSIIFVLLKDKLNLQVAVEHYNDAKKLTELILSKLKEI